jgi:hypothetical protein
VPDVEQVRPGQCPCCHAASRPTGAALCVIGHGLRDRQIRGPLAPGERPRLVVVLVRRYLCKACGAVITVVPRGVLARRHFSGSALAMAVALFGLVGESAAEVRRLVSECEVVGDAASAGWATLRRWLASLREGAVFRGLRAAGGTARAIAERAAAVLVAHAPPAHASAPLHAQAFFGAEHMA